MSGNPAQVPPPEILVIDDTPENLRLLHQILSGEYKVRLIPRGREALAAVQSRPPDLILLDIMMPDLNGFEVAEALKSQPSTHSIPILFISALDDMDSKMRAFELGGVDYITKPFQEREVLARVRTHLSIRSLQCQLEQQVQELQARNEELDAFAHTVAHDLKNPLGSVYLTALMLAESYDTMPKPEAVQLLQNSVKVVEMMNRALDGLMILSGLRQESVQLVAFDMAPVVAEALNSLKHTIEATHTEIITPASWPEVVGFIPWVEEVWVNYISNAIKYGGCPEQNIPPRVELGFDPPADGRLRFWLRDNGPGLTSEQQALLFTPFERLQNLRVKGHGLGLSIVRRIVEKLDGQAGVESVIDQGSTFFFTLPTQ